MPGKYIDKAVLTALLATASYILFLNLWNSIPLACAVSFILCVLLRKVSHAKPAHFKCTHAQAEAELMRIIAMNDEDAREAIEKLVRRKYPQEEFILTPYIKHPSSSLSVGEVFAQWKKHRGCKHVLIAATCASDARAVMYARELTEPRIAVVDRRHIIRMIRAAGICENTSSIPLFARLKRIPGNLTLRYSGIKNGLFGLILTGMYLVTGKLLYLVLGLFSLFLFGCTIPGKKYRKKLFP